MSAALQRERRATAGKRMAPLVGQAMDDDDAFWGHETWKEEGDSDDERSFHESDASVHNDEFDSDFDDSETDHEDEEDQAGQEEDDQLHKQERKQQHSQVTQRYVDIAKAGRDLMQKKKGKGRKRVMGDGINAGIVLNMPMAMMMSDNHQPPPLGVHGAPPIPPPPAAVAATNAVTLALPSSSSSSQHDATTTLPTSAVSPVKSPSKSSSTVAATRPRRVAAPLPPRQRLRRVVPDEPPSSSTPAATATATAISTATSATSPLKLPTTTTSSTSATTTTTTTFTRKANRELFTQEQLLLEAVHETEPDNERWILARRRGQESSLDASNNNKSLQNDGSNKNLIVRFHSRRGCRDTLTFADMDAVPEILTRNNHSNNKNKTMTTTSHGTNSANHTNNNPLLLLPQHQEDPSICVITGLKARYRDPKTNLGYHNAAAFAELRRRWQLQQQQQQKQHQQQRQATIATGAATVPTANKPATLPTATAASSTTAPSANKNNGTAKATKPSAKKAAKAKPSGASTATAKSTTGPPSAIQPPSNKQSLNGSATTAIPKSTTTIGTNHSVASHAPSQPTNSSAAPIHPQSSTTPAFNVGAAANALGQVVSKKGAGLVVDTEPSLVTGATPSLNLVPPPLTPGTATSAVSSSPSGLPSTRHYSFDVTSPRQPQQQAAINGNTPSTMSTPLRSPSTRKRKLTPKAMETTLPIPSIMATNNNQSDLLLTNMNMEEQPAPGNLFPRFAPDAALVATSSHNTPMDTTTLLVGTIKNPFGDTPNTIAPFLQPLAQNATQPPTVSTPVPAFPVPLTTPMASSSSWTLPQQQQIQPPPSASSLEQQQQQQQQQGVSTEPVHLRHGGEIGNQVAKRGRR